MERRYEFYFRVAKQTIFYKRAQRVSKILFLPLENKVHIFKPPCNVFFLNQKYFHHEKSDRFPLKGRNWCESAPLAHYRLCEVF